MQPDEASIRAFQNRARRHFKPWKSAQPSLRGIQTSLRQTPYFKRLVKNRDEGKPVLLIATNPNRMSYSIYQGGGVDAIVFYSFNFPITQSSPGNPTVQGIVIPPFLSFQFGVAAQAAPHNGSVSTDDIYITLNGILPGGAAFVDIIGYEGVLAVEGQRNAA